ncbi:cation:proton antiporter [Propionivibrio sp.]|uniref:cation:proton antiporter domain-containing protein n=1 Tax=Propionivibrio sp. TaxID=2212460 RepID=UPI0025EE8B63|nr:cation:proton antiporter [Propionivibrio sp.]
MVHLRGWAYGDGGAALRGKHCLWVATTGGDASSFAESGAHQLPFAAFEAPIRQTAKFCGMVWEPPIVLHGANVVSNDALEAAANAFRERLAAWAPSPVAGRGKYEGPVMLTDALIYLAAAVICVPIAQRLKLGAVLGYLIAGAIIGPWGLTLVTDVESIMHFSEFGVVLMLFVIGLELEPKRLIEMRKSVFGGGTLQVGLTGIALSLAAGAAGLGWKPALVVGLTLALSSTAIAIATMNERNFLSTLPASPALRFCSFRILRPYPCSPSFRCWVLQLREAYLVPMSRAGWPWRKRLQRSPR